MADRIPKLTKAQILEGVIAGRPLVLVEYRGLMVDEIKYNNKKTGAAVNQLLAKHAVEMGNRQIGITEWVPDGIKEAEVKQLYPKGTMLVLELEGLKEEKGNLSGSGQFFEFDAKG